MERMTTQTKIIVATAAALAVVDIAVRAFLPARTVVIREANTNANTLTVRQLRIVDDAGTVKMDLKVNSNGDPGLLMFDSTGTERLQLDTFQNIPSLILLDQDENRRVYFGMESDTGDGTFHNYSADQASPHIRHDN
jgi:hypothetical protein